MSEISSLLPQPQLTINTIYNLHNKHRQELELGVKHIDLETEQETQQDSSYCQHEPLAANQHIINEPSANYIPTEHN